jgi:hypothetical protein
MYRPHVYYVTVSDAERRGSSLATNDTPEEVPKSGPVMVAAGLRAMSCSMFSYFYSRAAIQHSSRTCLHAQQEAQQAAASVQVQVRYGTQVPRGQEVHYVHSVMGCQLGVHSVMGCMIHLSTIKSLDVSPCF